MGKIGSSVLRTQPKPSDRDSFPPTKLPHEEQSAALTHTSPPPPQHNLVTSPAREETAVDDRKRKGISWSRRKFSSNSSNNDLDATKADADASTTQNLIASALWNRYQEHGRLGDLEEAIRLERASLAAQETVLGAGAFDPLTAFNLGASLFDLYKHTRAPEALDESVQLFERTLLLMSEAQPAESSGDGALGVGVGVNVDVDVEKEHASLPRAKVNLANAYRARAELRGDKADLDRAIELHEIVLLQTPAGHAAWDLEIRQNCLARSLLARGSQRDIERAMDLLSFRRAVRGESAVDGIENALREQEAAVSARFKEHYFNFTWEFMTRILLIDSWIEMLVAVPDLTSRVRRLTDFASGLLRFYTVLVVPRVCCPRTKWI